jgi:hypothetical protein
VQIRIVFVTLLVIDRDSPIGPSISPQSGTTSRTASRASRSLPRLQPRLPTPSPDSDETVTENSPSEMVLRMGHRAKMRSGEAYDCKSLVEGKTRTACQMGMERKNKHLVLGFWRRFARGWRGADNHVGHLGVDFSGTYEPDVCDAISDLASDTFRTAQASSNLSFTLAKSTSRSSTPP